MLFDAPVEVRKWSNFNSVGGFLPVNMPNQSGVDFIDEQERLDALHRNQELQEASHKERQGAQGVLDHVEQRDNRKSDVKA